MSKIDKVELRSFLTELKRKSLEKGYSTDEADYIVSKAPDLVKGFGKDLQKQFPNGQWKTINGARVFLNGGKVVAGLDNFNGMIDEFFKEKKESKKDSGSDKKNEFKTEYETIKLGKVKKNTFGEKVVPFTVDSVDEGKYKVEMPTNIASNKRYLPKNGKVEDKIDRWLDENVTGEINNDKELIKRIKEIIEGESKVKPQNNNSFKLSHQKTENPIDYNDLQKLKDYDNFSMNVSNSQAMKRLDYEDYYEIVENLKEGKKVDLIG